jgi:hypothetical protein
MAWIKIPKEHHPIFMNALPKQPRSTILPMFGGLAAMVNGNIGCALFGRSVMVRLGDKDLEEALALDGASVFDPMGRGAPREDKAMLPEDVLGDPAELRSWLQRALDHTATLPKKAPKITKRKTPASRKPVAKARGSAARARRGSSKR